MILFMSSGDTVLIKKKNCIKLFINEVNYINIDFFSYGNWCHCIQNIFFLFKLIKKFNLYYSEIGSILI